MTATPVTHELVDICVRLSPSAWVDLSLKVFGIGDLLITKLLMHRLGSTAPRYLEKWGPDPFYRAFQALCV